MNDQVEGTQLIGPNRRLDDVDLGREIQFLPKTLSLAVAQSEDNPLELVRAGTFLYVDDDTDGKVYLRLNDKTGARIPIQAGFSFSNVPYKRMFLDWSAQAGKSINFVHGFGAVFNPTNDIANIGQVGSISNPLTPRTIATLYNRNSASAALGTIVLPAANTAGIRIDKILIGSSGQVRNTLMAKTSAPATFEDATAHMLAYSDNGAAANNYPQFVQNYMTFPYIVPAGMGLYEQSNSGAVVSRIYVDYEVLS